MKVPKGGSNHGGDNKGCSSRRQRNGQRVRKAKDEHVTELLKMCLLKVCQLQEDLQRSEDFENDPQAAGYAACATEALRFLAAQGLPNDHPVVQTLTEKLVQDPQV